MDILAVVLSLLPGFSRWLDQGAVENGSFAVAAWACVAAVLVGGSLIGLACAPVGGKKIR